MFLHYQPSTVTSCLCCCTAADKRTREARCANWRRVSSDRCPHEQPDQLWHKVSFSSRPCGIVNGSVQKLAHFSVRGCGKVPCQSSFLGEAVLHIAGQLLPLCAYGRDQIMAQPSVYAHGAVLRTRRLESCSDLVTCLPSCPAPALLAWLQQDLHPDPVQLHLAQPPPGAHLQVSQQQLDCQQKH